LLELLPKLTIALQQTQLCYKSHLEFWKNKHPSKKIIKGWKHSQVDQLVYFFGLNYKYFKIYHDIIKHVIWLGEKIEVYIVLDFMWKNMIKKNLMNS